MAFRKIPVRFGRKYRAASKIQKACVENTALLQKFKKRGVEKKDSNVIQ